MENLVGRKVKCIQSYDTVTKGKEYIITDVDNNGFYIIEYDGRKHRWNNSHLTSEKYFKLLPNEHQFKQGDKVLVSNNKSYWVECEFITEYKDEFIVKTNSDIIRRKHIKPYEEEIKIGDWVKRNNEIIKVYETPMKKDWTKITNPELIKLLNNEL